MDEELTREGLLELMPELEGSEVVIEELKGGITNRLYRVRSSKGQDLVVRLYGEKTELFIDRDVEVENLKLIASTGITPRLIKYLPDQRVTVVEFIPGYVLKNEDFLREDLWEEIVRSIRTIHQSGVTLPFVFDPLVQVRRLYRILQGIDASYWEFEFEKTISSLEKISNHARITPAQYVSCHNDLLADNFILGQKRDESGRSIYVIDWEYAGMSTPYYDLADMFQEILVPRETEARILDLYWQGANTDHHIYMTDLFKPFPDIYWFLWSLIQSKVSKIDFDFYSYGKAKYDNAQKNIRYLRERYGLSLPS
ncbi:MAG: phosphotransferase [Deltaproteobacteria bacterium]|nr:phosphotransferase [Deltaproteobacteria bacterium]